MVWDRVAHLQYLVNHSSGFLWILSTLIMKWGVFQGWNSLSFSISPAFKMWGFTNDSIVPQRLLILNRANVSYTPYHIPSLRHKLPSLYSWIWHLARGELCLIMGEGNQPIGGQIRFTRERYFNAQSDRKPNFLFLINPIPWTGIMWHDFDILWATSIFRRHRAWSEKYIKDDARHPL